MENRKFGAWKILRDRMSEKCSDHDMSDSQTSHIVYEVHCDGTQNDQLYPSYRSS